MKFFIQLKALDQQLPECYRSELSKKAIGSKVLPATQNASSTTSAPFPATNTTAPKRFLPQPIPIPARPVDLSKPCRCPLCPRSFLHNGGLRVHIERCTLDFMLFFIILSIHNTDIKFLICICVCVCVCIHRPHHEL